MMQLQQEFPVTCQMPLRVALKVSSASGTEYVLVRFASGPTTGINCSHNASNFDACPRAPDSFTLVEGRDTTIHERFMLTHESNELSSFQFTRSCLRTQCRAKQQRAYQVKFRVLTGVTILSTRGSKIPVLEVMETETTLSPSTFRLWFLPFALRWEWISPTWFRHLCPEEPTIRGPFTMTEGSVLGSPVHIAAPEPVQPVQPNSNNNGLMVTVTVTALYCISNFLMAYDTQFNTRERQFMMLCNLVTSIGLSVCLGWKLLLLVRKTKQINFAFLCGVVLPMLNAVVMPFIPSADSQLLLLICTILQGVAVISGDLLRSDDKKSETNAKTKATATDGPIPQFITNTFIRDAIDAGKECPIMFEPFTRGHTAMMSCGHLFTSDALQETFLTAADGVTVCPMCRKPGEIIGIA